MVPCGHRLSCFAQLEDSLTTGEGQKEEFTMQLYCSTTATAAAVLQREPLPRKPLLCIPQPLRPIRLQYGRGLFVCVRTRVCVLDIHPKHEHTSPPLKMRQNHEK